MRKNFGYKPGQVVVSKFSDRRMFVTSIAPDGFMAGVWIGEIGQPEFPGARDRAARCMAGQDMPFMSYDADAFEPEGTAKQTPLVTWQLIMRMAS